jgi:hypothetical protein
MAYGGKHRPIGIILLGTNYTTDLTSVPVGALTAGLSLGPFQRPPLPRRHAMMRVPACCRPSLASTYSSLKAV